jgi:ArsR family transcriptional regulator
MDSEMAGVDWPYRAELLKTLGHPVRLQIIAILCRRDESVGDLAAEIQVGQATVSQQLSILRMRGLVSSVRVGGKAIYSLEEVRLREIVNCVEGCRNPAGGRARRPVDNEETTRSAADL